MKGKHCEYLDLGNGVTSIACGVLDDCDHDSDGEWLLFNDNGEYFKSSDIPGYEKQSAEALDFMNNHHLNGGCSSCSKCGKPFEFDMNII